MGTARVHSQVAIDAERGRGLEAVGAPADDGGARAALLVASALGRTDAAKRRGGGHETLIETPALPTTIAIHAGAAARHPNTAQPDPAAS
jgi:hypothetical protein